MTLVMQLSLWGVVSLESLNEWVTLIAAIIAAITSTSNWWRGLHEKSDKIKVNFGAIQPPIAPGLGMHVISCADHAMTIQDYGFFDSQGRLLSIPDMLANNECDDGICFGGATFLEERGSIFEISYVLLRDRQIGAYAKTAGQDSPLLRFRPGVRWYLRWWLSTKARFQMSKFQ